jgi:hypothetical protein
MKYEKEGQQPAEIKIIFIGILSIVAYETFVKRAGTYIFKPGIIVVGVQ